MANKSNYEERSLPELEAIPLSISIVNTMKESEGFAYLFMSDDKPRDAQWGTLEITIRNLGEDPIEVTANSHLEIEIPADLMTAEDVTGIELSQESRQHWDLVKVTQKIQLKPSAGQVINITKDEPQKITLEGALAGMGDHGDGVFTFVWSGFGRVKDNSRAFWISRDFIPGQKDKEVEIGCAWLERTEYSNRAKDIYVTPFEIKPGRTGIGNRLVLQIENVKDEALEIAGTEFIVFFPTETSTGVGAPMCTNEQLNQVVCRPLGLQAAQWSQEPIKDGKTTYWVLRPPKSSIKVFEKGNLVSFEFSDIVTQMALGSSQVLVQWRGIKGRSPGYKLIAVTRTEAEPYVLSYGASLNDEPLKNNDAVDFKDKVRLDWELFASDSCIISGVDKELDASGMEEVLPDKKVNSYKLTPQITIDGRIKTGKDNILNLKVRPPEVDIDVDPDTVTRPEKVKLKWECKSGDCFLSGPNITREEVKRSDSREVWAEEGDYQIECSGIIKRTGSIAINIPLANAVVKLKPVSTADKVELTWTSTNAVGCNVTKKKGDIALSTALNGSVQMEASQSPGVGVWGNGYWHILYILQEKLDAYPEVVVHETRSGSQYTFSWNVTNAVSCEITGPGLKSREIKGEYKWEPKGEERIYRISALALATAMAFQWQPSWAAPK